MSKAKAKKITGYINLCLPAQKATPAPPVGPAFGQKGASGMEFCKQFNDATKKLEVSTPTRVKVTVFSDRSFVFDLLGTPISYMLKKAAGLEKGSSEPGRNSAGTIELEKVKDIAKRKMEQGLSARNMEAAIKIVSGSARSIGLKIINTEEEAE